MVPVALAYTAFVIYGSLVPLQFRPLAFVDALDAFQRIGYLSLGIGSRADWVANILLFIPLAFLWLGAFWSRRRLMQALVSILCLSVCSLLSGAIEFVQLYFPPRTVSLNDIVAESIGAVIGIASWWVLGERSLGWLVRIPRLQGREAVFGALLTGYLALLFGYSLLPLDLTLSPVEIFHKWRDGRLRFLPFQGWGDLDGAKLVYELAIDIVVWVVPAALWMGVGMRSSHAIFTRIMASAILLEFLQLFVYSRVSDVTDIFTAGVGAVCGIRLGRFFFRIDVSKALDANVAPVPRSVLWFGLAAVWVAVLVVVFWYPFDFRTDWSFVREKLGLLRRVPFELLYYGSEFRAITEVFHKAGFFFPLGLSLAMAMDPMRFASAGVRLLMHCVAFSALAAAAFAVELGQLFLPARHADLTDWFLEVTGGCLGYVLTILISARLRGAEKRGPHGQ